MPFKSEAQRKLCYLLKNKGESGSWDCDEWSASTGKKKLPEHVKKQTEKDAALEAVIKLARCWAGYEPVPGKEPYSNDSCRPKSRKKKDSKKEEKKAELFSIFSKMSAVATSPGRGSGDEEETAINPDSSEGMQKARPAKPVPGKMSPSYGGNKPVSTRGAARNAATKASISVLGFDPRCGSVKKADKQPASPPVASTPMPAPASSAGPSITPAQIWKHKNVIAPTAWNTLKAGLGSNEAMSSLQTDANRFNWSALKDNWSALKDNAANAWNHPSTQKGIQDMYKKRLGHSGMAGLAWKYKTLDPNKIMAAESARINGDMNKWVSGLSGPISKNPVAVLGNFAGNAAHDYAADSEARRVSAGYGLQAAQFMRNNPFLVAGLGGLGAYGLISGLDGALGGGSSVDNPASTMQDQFNQGYAAGSVPTKRRRPAA